MRKVQAVWIDSLYARRTPAVRVRRRVALLVLAAGLAATANPSHAQDATGEDANAPPPRPQPGVTPSTLIQPAGSPAPVLRSEGGEVIQISEMSEPLELRTFVEYVASVLGLNIVASDTLTGTVVVNAPIEVPRDQLLSLLDSLLHQQNFAIVRHQDGFYTIQALDKLGMALGGEGATTRIIPTPGLRPSALRETIQQQMTSPDRPLTRISFVDDLGVIVMTDSPRRLDEVGKLVERFIALRGEQKFLRFEVEHISAAVARQRVIELLSPGSSSSTPGQIQVTPEGQIVQGGGGGGRLAGLPERLTVDAQGNCLIFRGTPDEATEVESVLAVLDVPNNLETRVYFAGSAASAIADIARERGLARIQQVESAPTEAEGGAGMAPGQRTMPTLGDPGGLGMPGQTPSAPSGGPTLIVDTSRGILLYAGTASQHEQLATIIKQFDTEQDQIVIQTYPVNHGDAGEITELILGLLLNQEASGGTASGRLLPQNTGGRTGGRSRGSEQQGGFGESGAGLGTGSARRGNRESGSSSGPIGGGEGDLYVSADVKNNQIIVKAPQKLQPEFARLIEKVDLRRPQVYLEAKIVSVTASDEFRLAFNTQLINANGTGGILDFNTGLLSAGTDGTALDRKAVDPSLLGVTAALIKSEYVPIVITALQQNVDTRILSSPQLLIDDNETAELVSLEEQPTTTTTQSTGNPAQTSFGNYQSAGTTLTVTPTITKGGFVRLEYYVNLSSFVGSGSGGVPPARLTNEVSGDKVTIPGDTTVVIGGLTVDTLSKTVIKVPLLGEIPLLGHLFRDQGKTDRKTSLYIFLTPKILREPTIPDLILLTRGPQSEVGLNFEMPALQPAFIEIFELQRLRPAPPTVRPGP
ncbi:MAG: secretin N-terminal domain-containing protein [Phycisphaerales bacterium]